MHRLVLNPNRSLRLFRCVHVVVVVCVASICLYAAEGAPDKGQSVEPVRSRKPVQTTIKLNTGVNETFQLTLGGLFTDGVNQQSGATVDFKNLISNDSTLRVAGLLHLDTADLNKDWIGSVNYLQPILKWETGSLQTNVGFHVWHFPSVLQGKTDTVVDSGLILTQTRVIPLVVDANVKTLSSAEVRRGVGGQIYYFRAISPRALYRKGSRSFTLLHGPSYTYSNRFYGTRGHRVFRYEIGAAYQAGPWGVDTVFRPQWALQKGIRENRFWGVNVSYTFQP